MKNGLRRPRLNEDIEATLTEHLYKYVKANPGRQVPGTYIAQKYGIARSQVTATLRRMCQRGQLGRLTRYTYEALPQPPVQKADLHEVPADDPIISAPPNSIPTRIAPLSMVVEMAKDFNWRTGSDSLKEFIRDLQKPGEDWRGK